MIYMIESQVAYVVDAIRQMRERGWAAVDVRPEAQAAFNEKLQKKQSSAVWASGCKSWYLDASGKNTTLWPDFTFRFRKETAAFDAESYAIDT